MRWIDALCWGAGLLTMGALALLRRHAARLPRLPEAPREDAPLPSVCLCMPARNEAQEIGAALDSWLAQLYPSLRIVVVDDGSTDDTPALLAERAARHPERLRVLRNEALPPGWLGKNHALHLAVQQPEAREAEWLLFADADVQASPDLLRRALAFLDLHPADLLALLFAMDAQGFWEEVVLPLLGAGILLFVPPHRVPDPRHPSFCGIGAFTLVRRSAYEAVGGHAAAPMEAIDDMFLARRVKRAGYVNRVAQGSPDLHLRMYHGLPEILRGLRKNMAAFAGWWLLPLALPLLLAGHLSPLWMPWAGHGGLALGIWLAVPALAGDVAQRLTGRPMDWKWALWPLIGAVVTLGATLAFWDRLRGVNAWRGRRVRLGLRPDPSGAGSPPGGAGG